MRKLLTILIALSIWRNCSGTNYELIPRWTINPWATTYYISATGNDATGTGTIGNPWASLYKATSTVTTSGDVIHVSGSHTETTQSLLAVGVSIEGDDTTTSIIKSSITADFTEIVRLASATVGTAGNQHISFLKFDGQALTTAVAIGVYARSNVSIHDVSFRDFRFAWGIINGNPNLFGANSSETEPSTYATGNTVYNIRSLNCGGFDNWGGSWYGSAHLWIPGQKDLVIHDCYMNQTERATRANGWLIKATNFTKGVEIYNCTLNRARYTYANPGDWDGTSQYWDFVIECGDVIGMHIHHNTLSGSTDINRNTKGTYPYAFSFHDNIVGPTSLGSGYENGCILEYWTETANIYNNTFRNIANIIEFSTRSLSYVNDVTITKNLAYNIGAANGNHSGGAVHLISDGSNNYTTRNLIITNNTFAASATYTPYYGISLSNAGSIKVTTIDNNIIMNFDQFGIGANTATPIDTFSFQNNLMYGNGGSNDPVWISGIPSHATTTTPIKLDPLFTNTGTNDYTLQSGSPAKNAGTDGTDIGYTGGSPSVLPKPKYKLKGKVKFN